jgi:hypothetical protein
MGCSYSSYGGSVINHFDSVHGVKKGLWYTP